MRFFLEFSIATAVVLSVVWAILWLSASALDRGHCLDNGAEYSHTTASLDGWCIVGGITVRAEWVGSLGQ